MSTAKVKLEIAKFLAAIEPEVLCIRGNWGTGKTFSWNEELQANIKRISRENYAYVSLFGLNSVGDIKQEIFQATMAKDRIGKPFDIENVKSSWRSGLGYLKQAGTLFTQLLGDDYKVIGLSVASLLVRNQLICFDDLERKGEGLRSADVLGYISQLKEERNCKVVLLLNDQQLEDRDKFENYLEKVVDLNLKYAPNPMESIEIALNNVSGGSDVIKSLMRERAVTLGIDNIRVIRKIYRLVVLIEPMLKQFAPEVFAEVASSLILFGWAHYQPEIAPTIAFLKDKRTFLDAERKANEEADPKIERWKKTLEDYGYRYTDAFDLVLMQGIADGYFHQESVDSHAKELHKRAEAQQAHQELRESWRSYHQSLTNTAEDVLRPIVECFLANCQFYSLNDLNSIINISRSLNYPQWASEALEKYISIKKDVKGAFDLSNLYLTNEDDLAPDIREALTAAALAQNPEYGVDEMFLRLREEGYDTEMNIQLAELPVEEYIRVFKSHNGEKFDDIVNGVRQWLGLLNPTDAINTIMDKSALAFIEIGKESDINAYRTRRWGLIERYKKRHPEPEAKIDTGTAES